MGIRAAAVTGLLALLVAGGMSGCGDDDSAERSSDGVITEAGSLNVFDLEVGDCVQATDREIDIETVEAIPCGEPHTHEVFALVDLGEDADEDGPFGRGAPYPGEGELGQEAEARCADAFSTYVGSDYLNSSLFFTYLVPSVRSWQDDNERDREIVCLAMDAGKPMTGSVRGSGL